MLLTDVEGVEVGFWFEVPEVPCGRADTEAKQDANRGSMENGRCMIVTEREDEVRITIPEFHETERLSISCARL